jgi:hypothetical protein
MSDYLTGSIYRVDYSVSKKEEVFDTEISELYQPPRTIIETSDDFWNFFNDTSSAIPIHDPDDRSWQYLVNQAFILDNSSIIVWNGEEPITFNDIGRLYYDSKSLAEQKNALELIIQNINDDKLKIENGNFESWTDGFLDGWDHSWENPMPRVSQITGFDGGIGVRIETSAGHPEGEELDDNRHTAISLREDNMVWIEPFVTYKLSGLYKTIGNNSTAQIWIGDGRGAGVYNDYDYSWKKTIVYNSTDVWTPFEIYFVPILNLHLDPVNGQPYPGCRTSIYLYNGSSNDYDSVACYDNLKIEKIANYTGSQNVTDYGEGTETIYVTLNYNVTGSYGIGYVSGSKTQILPRGYDGAAVEVEMEDLENFDFVGWDDGVETKRRQDKYVLNDINTTAIFSIKEPKRSVTYSIENGRLNDEMGPITITVPYSGSGQEIFVDPIANYHFVSWSDGSFSNPRIDTYITENFFVEAQLRYSDSDMDDELLRNEEVENLNI